jgi:hypothetical protein
VSGCGGNACTCLLRYGETAMTADEVAALPAAADACFGPVPAEDDVACLPLTIGSDGSGISILATYAEGEVIFVYDAVGEEDCCIVGGIPRYGTDGYLGCSPVPVATASTCVEFP